MVAFIFILYTLFCLGCGAMIGLEYAKRVVKKVIEEHDSKIFMEWIEQRKKQQG
jgi:uncharacterized membrane protein